MLDILLHSAYCFKRTKVADKYIQDKCLILPDTIQDTFNGCAFGQEQTQIPHLDVVSYVYSYIRAAKQVILNRCDYSKIVKSILKESEKEILQISQVVLVHSDDDGEFIPIANRFMLMKESNETEEIFQRIQIPTKGSLVESDPKHPLLGCYLSKPGVILIWIDRVFESAEISGYLLFQKVLLHEIIHAMFDCADRNKNLDVLLDKSKERRNFEETLDNLLVLKCYENCEKDIFEEILHFIKSQPREYSRAIDLYEMTKTLKWRKKEFVSTICSLLFFKVFPNQGISNPLFLYVAGPDEDETSDNKDWAIGIMESSKMVIDIPYSKIDEQKEDIDSNNTILSYTVFTKRSFITPNGEKITLNKIIVTLTISNVLQNEMNCSFHYKRANGSIGRMMYYKVLREDEMVDEIINTSLVVGREKYYGKYVVRIIKSLNPDSIYHWCNFIIQVPEA